MSYIKKIEDDYNNGKISLKEISDLRDEYNKKDNDEKLKLDNKYNSGEYSNLLKNNQIESNSNQVETTIDLDVSKYIGYVVAVLSSFIYVVITGEFSADLASLFGSVVGALIIPVIISGIIILFKKNLSYGKVLGLSTPILQALAYFGQTL